MTRFSGARTAPAFTTFAKTFTPARESRAFKDASREICAPTKKRKDFYERLTAGTLSTEFRECCYLKITSLPPRAWLGACSLEQSERRVLWARS